MDVRSRRSNPKRPRAATVSVGHVDGDGGSCSCSGSGVDLISGLNDDLLLRILDRVPAAENVVRTHALSRRWRGLWTGVTALRFDFDSSRRFCSSDGAAERYIAFINGALALRATAANEPAFVEDLAISFNISRHETEQLVPLSVEAAQGWIRYAVQHAVKSFILKLGLPWQRFDMDGNVVHRVMTLDEMDNYAKMETLQLRLSGAQLQLPSSAVVFSSLIDLSLERIVLPDGGSDLLSRLVSSACCPHLHKLCLRQLIFDNFPMGGMLRIEADTLLELSLESMDELQFLVLRTPSLQVLHIVNSFNLIEFTVLAPRLENLWFWVQQPLHINDVHGQLSSVGTLKIQMYSYGNTELNTEDRNDASIHILQCCRSTRCLEVSFEIPKTKYQTIDIIKGRIPLLPCVTQLKVDIKMRERHSSGPGVACLLAQCSNIKFLSLRLRYIVTKRNPSELDPLCENQSELDLLCDNNSCHWKSHDFSLLAHLQEVEFKKLMGTVCEFQFIQSILTKAIGIQKVTISLDRFYWQKGRKHALKLMPPLDGGLWTCKDAMFYEDVVCEWETRE